MEIGAEVMVPSGAWFAPLEAAGAGAVFMANVLALTEDEVLVRTQGGKLPNRWLPRALVIPAPAIYMP